MNILVCGDICPGGLLAYQESFYDKSLYCKLQSFDLRVCTLEGAVGTGFPYEPSKMSSHGGNNNICYIRNEDFGKLKELNINLVSLANNHSLDLGVDGFKNTLKILENNNIKYCGAGMNIIEASKPAVFYDNDGSSIAFFAFCIEGTYPYSCNVANFEKPGIYKANIENILLKVKEYSKKYDLLFLLPHWGEEHKFFPPTKCVDYAKKLLSAGADAIFGSHSHTYGPINKCGKKIIGYGMGNFLFPDFMMEPPRPMFYPKNIKELSTFKRVINYPKEISEPTISIWDEESRIGMNYTFQTRTKKTGYFFTKLSQGNKILLLQDEAPLRNFLYRKVKIPLGSMLVGCPFYKIIHRIIKRI